MTASLSGIPEIRLLLAADLVAVGCPTDDRCHLVDERHFAEQMLAACSGWGPAADVRALCTCRVTPDSLLAEPRPICRDCVRVAQPRLRDAMAAREPVRRRRPVAGAVAALVAALVHPHDLVVWVSTGLHGEAGGRPCP